MKTTFFKRKVIESLSAQTENVSPDLFNVKKRCVKMLLILRSGLSCNVVHNVSIKNITFKLKDS